MGSVALTAEQVQGYVDAADEELAQVRLELEPLLHKQSQLQERQALLKELLASFGEPVTHPPTAALDAGRARTGGRRRTVRDRVHDEVVDVLEAIGRPLHINDLLEEYIKHGYDPPGQGKPANISVHLSGWQDVVSPERGVYGLASMFDTQDSKQQAKTSKRG